MSDLPEQTGRVFLRGLALDTVIGVHAWEREVRQRLLLDLDMACSLAAAVASDEVGDALDYAAVAGRVREFAGEAQCRLIEKLAEELAQLILREFAVSWVRLQLRKPGAVTGAEDLGVIIERRRQGPAP